MEGKSNEYYKFETEASGKNPTSSCGFIEDETFTIEDMRLESRMVMKRLLSVTSVSFTFMCVELVGGWLANSLAILTDAAHLSSDVSGFLISIFSIWIGMIPAKKYSLSYGYHRAEIIGALTSVLIIWALTVWLVIEAFNRLFNPTPVDGFIMLITSIFGLCCNLVMGLILNTNICGKIEIEPRISKMARKKKNNDELIEKRKTSIDPEASLLMEQEHRRKTENPNLRAAVIHILGDTIQSSGVILAAIIIYVNPDAVVADPICTFMFSIVVLATTIGVATDCIRCMMESVPKELNVIDFEKELSSVAAIKDLHDLHIWAITTGKISLSAHINSTDPTTTLIAANKVCAKYGIFHTTIQVENWEERKKLNCKHLKTNLIHE